ncbi:CDP-glycerol glycerophosphotransferase family protein [Bacillus sp. 7894-2]|uniref:CDP-glycerol glycerophosphotransferase family protein n=1 Tax=Bacillus sp. 7894-2 TaxID=2021695 RepID=UPI001155132E|nr:CDP-glycerol glycerophosphotransferase family protein [Bacillus sp. 7894-2]
MNIKMAPTLLVKFIIQVSFFLFSIIFPVNKHKVTFASYRSEQLEGNLLYIHREFNKRSQDFEFEFLFKKFNSTISGKLNYFLHMLKASYSLATSRFFIIDDFYFPVYVVKQRKGTEVIQLWHAAGAFKKFGLSTINKPFGPSKEYLRHVKIHSNYSRVYVTSANVIPHYAEAFGMPQERIYPLGLPRTDYFFMDEEKAKVKQKFLDLFPEHDGKQLILFAPTFRGSSHYQTKYTIPIDIGLLKDRIGDEYSFLIHLHPYMKSGIEIREDEKDFACQIGGEFTIEELLSLADILVTDYSSIIFDYSLLRRPIVFFADDLERYKQDRDFYFEYESFIPGPLVENANALATKIQQGNFDLKPVSDFRDFFFDRLDGKASERIVDHLLSNGKTN